MNSIGYSTRVESGGVVGGRERNPRPLPFQNLDVALDEVIWLNAIV